MKRLVKLKNIYWKRNELSSAEVPDLTVENFGIVNSTGWLQDKVSIVPCGIIARVLKDQLGSERQLSVDSLVNTISNKDELP